MKRSEHAEHVLQNLRDYIADIEREPMGDNQLFVVRLYDGFDYQWMDVCKPVPYEQARAIWLEKTEGGTRRTSYDDIDYYNIFPANTRMLYSAKGMQDD